jgi:D-allose transport system ATP-binding protein
VDQMIAMMVGRELDRKTRLEPAVKRENPQTIFEVRDLSRRDGKVEHVGFELKEGEILGFSGLMGSGRTELMEAIFGVVPVKGGEIWLNGKRLTHRSTYGALRNRIAFITEDRRDTGFFSNFSILQNLAISKELLDSRLGGLWGRVDLKRDRILALEQREALSIKCSSVDQNITELSGGNQQKVLIGKWLATEPAVVIFDEPTKGIDVGSKAEIYRIMRRLADEGKGVIMVSSELPELLFICDRIVVFSQGKKTAELPAATATEESIMRAATRTFQHV